VAFVGLNPAGHSVEPDHPSFACFDGTSAYASERRKGSAPGHDALQRQVQLLFAVLGVAPAEVLAGNLVPFRSPTWDALPDKRRALSFGRRIWETIFATARPKLVVAMGSHSASYLADLLRVQTESVEIGWGHTTGTRGRNDDLRFVGLPHLSRFKLFGRAASVDALEYLLEDW
jgi:uracil-DNA glycosylase